MDADLLFTAGMFAFGVIATLVTIAIVVLGRNKNGSNDKNGDFR